MGTIGFGCGIIIALCMGYVTDFSINESILIVAVLGLSGLGIGILWEKFLHQKFQQWRFMRAARGR